MIASQRPSCWNAAWYVVVRELIGCEGFSSGVRGGKLVQSVGVCLRVEVDNLSCGITCLGDQVTTASSRFNEHLGASLPETREFLLISSNANDLLEAVGVSSDVSGAGRNASDDWELVALHYHQHQIHTLLVLEAHDLDNYLTGKLLELAATLDLQVILVAHPSRRGELPGLLDAWPHERLDRDRFDDCATADQMLTVVRATQVALFEAGIYLQVDIDAFLGSMPVIFTWLVLRILKIANCTTRENDCDKG